MRKYLEQTVALCDHVSEALCRRQVLVQVLLVRSACGVLLLHGPGDEQADLHSDVPSSNQHVYKHSQTQRHRVTRLRPLLVYFFWSDTDTAS